MEGEGAGELYLKLLLTANSFIPPKRRTTQFQRCLGGDRCMKCPHAGGTLQV